MMSAKLLLSAAAMVSVAPSIHGANSIIDRAADLGLSTLVAAVEAAGLVDTLSGPGPFTLFGEIHYAVGVLS